VPDVRWRSQADAVAELTLLGFHIRSDHEYTTIVCTLPVPPPTVIEQAPAGGSTVIRGANITLGITDYKLLANEC
jgi:beta-lactam-binding protein with PASTA domain